ncbi:MAG: tRNA dihydrouridine synthase DusB [Actinomycetota bacterium]|nr:tRNA dihydrouridine synthase DusB [Actinomycetota bacterium]
MESFKLPDLIDELGNLVLKYFTDHVLSGLAERLPVFDTNKHKFDFNIPDHSFKIGNVKIKNPLISAPLAGISDNTFRIFAGFFGSALNCTEMISSYGIVYGHKKSLALADITDYERPCAIQIFGPDPEIITEAALRIEDRADIIDINMGCPVPKVLKAKSGGYLIQDEEKVKKIISRLSSALKKPLTIKTRIGWDTGSINILNIAKIAEYCGAKAISIHGRTVKQRFSGEVNYELIKKVKEKIKIPVIVSGDINTPGKALEILDYTGCDGIMIGRAIKGRLWLLTSTLIFLLAGYKESTNTLFNSITDPGLEWKKELSKLYLKFMIYFKGEERGVREFRKRLSWIFKGEKEISKKREGFFKIDSFKDAVKLINNI